MMRKIPFAVAVTTMVFLFVPTTPALAAGGRCSCFASIDGPICSQLVPVQKNFAEGTTVSVRQVVVDALNQFNCGTAASAAAALLPGQSSIVTSGTCSSMQFNEAVAFHDVQLNCQFYPGSGGATLALRSSSPPPEVSAPLTFDEKAEKQSCWKLTKTAETREVCTREVGKLYETKIACEEALVQECLTIAIEKYDKVKQGTFAGEKDKNSVIVSDDLRASVKSLNPLGISSISELISRVVRVAVSFMGTIALAMCIYGGILWMFSQGNAEKAKKATKVIVWSTLGVIVIMSSYAIVNFILEAFTL